MADFERIFTAVDVSNLFKACRLEFGLDARVDFLRLSEMVPRMRLPHDVQQHLVAYTVVLDRQKHMAFSHVLRTFGYEVRERHMRYAKGLMSLCSSCGHREVVSKATRSDWDVGITVDVMDRVDQFDTFVLVSGDGDFSILLEYLKTKGKRTVVLAFEASTAQQLYDVADERCMFDESILHKKETNRGT